MRMTTLGTTQPPLGRRGLLFVLTGALAFLAAPAADAQVTFCEEGGLIVIQIESVPPVESWLVETGKPGYTGDSYYRWNGSNFFNDPGHGTLSFTLEVTTAADYELRIRNLHDNPDNTLENDCWTRMDGSAWKKVFSPSASMDWNFASWFEKSSDTMAHYNLSAGTHTFQISARSKHFRIDRIHLFTDEVEFPNALFHPESICAGPWVDLGDGLAGTGAIPALAGTGDLTIGSSNQLDLTGALANATTNLVVGLSTINAAFKGGIMVPDPDLLVLGLPVDNAGNSSLPFVWPGGLPIGTILYFQHWVEDAGGPLGFAASNGLEASIP